MDKIEEMIFPINITEEVSQSFLDYSLSVITDRALPDVRDGLKPVHRRIIYTMFEDGMFNNKPHKKSAQTVGSVLSRYHAHGDSSVYEAMVRLAQDFSLREPLVDGHGAFGDIDGNAAAAYRYTEARLSKIAEEMIRDIKKDSIDWKLNFSEDRYEPTVLPSRFPNLLVNGSTGIAVGMACSFAPHNLNQTINAVIEYIKNTDISGEELYNLIGGPDFPTGGLVINKDELLSGYLTGRGRIRIRSKYKIETRAKRTLIVFYELPYMTKKTKIIEDIVALCESKEIEGISDVRDESDEKIALVIELAKGYDAENIANVLFAKTQLENTYSINNTCLVDGEPKVLSLKSMIKHYVEFQEEVLTRRTKYELHRVLVRLNLIEGLIIALSNIEKVIAIIRESESTNAAGIALVKEFLLNEEQAKAILDMKLSRLTKLEVNELKTEKAELIINKNRFESILNNHEELNKLLITEISEIQHKYKSPRKTEITQFTFVKEKKNSKPEVVVKPIIVAIDSDYTIKFIEEKQFKNKKNNNDYIYIISTDTSDSLSIFMNNGKLYKLPLDDLKDNSNIIALLSIKDEKIIDILADTSKKYIVFLTKQGMIKKSLLDEYKNIKRSGIIGINLKENDEVVSICYINEEPLIIMSSKGLTIKIQSNEVTATGRNTMGVLGIKLKDDSAASLTPVYDNKQFVLIITKNGFIKKTKKEEYTLQKRNGVGIIGTKITSSDQALAIIAVNENDTILIYSNDKLVKIPCTDVPTIGRTSQGNHIVKSGNVNNIHII